MDLLIVSHFGSTYSENDNDRFLYLAKSLDQKNEKNAKSKNIRFFQSRPRNHYGFPEIIKSGVEITYGVWLRKHVFS